MEIIYCSQRIILIGKVKQLQSQLSRFPRHLKLIDFIALNQH